MVPRARGSNTSQNELASVDAGLEQLEEFLCKAERKNEEKRRLSEAERLLRQAERELGREVPSQETLKNILKEVEGKESDLSDELRDFIERQRIYLEEEHKRLKEVQIKSEEQRSLGEIERLLRKAERELARAAVDQSQGTLNEVQCLTSEFTLPPEMQESIKQRLEHLRMEQRWLEEKHSYKEAERLLREVESDLDREGTDLSRSGLDKRVIPSSIPPLTQDRRVYAEITPLQGPIEPSSKATFGIVLHTPYLVPAEHGFTLIAWPANRPYAPDIATVLGQPIKQPEAEPGDQSNEEQSDNDSQPVPAVSDQAVEGEGAEPTALPEGQETPQTMGAADGHTRANPEEQLDDESLDSASGRTTHFQVEVAQVDLMPGHYQVALAYNDVPLPGRAELELISHGEAEDTRRLLQSLKRIRWVRVGLGLLSLIAVGALVVIAVAVLVSLARSPGAPPSVIQVPAPGDSVVTAISVPAQQAAGVEAFFSPDSLTVGQTAPLTLTASVEATNAMLPEGGYFFVIRPAGRLASSDDQLEIATLYDQDGEGRVSIGTEIKRVDLSPGRYWVSVMIGSGQVPGMPLELIVQPLAQSVEVQAFASGATQVDGRHLALVNRPVRFVFLLSSGFLREVGGKVLLVEDDKVLATSSEHLDLSRGSQTLIPIVRFAEPGRHAEMALMWQPETDENWYPFDVALPTLEVISDAVTVGSDGGRMRLEPDFESEEVAFLEPDDKVRLTARSRDNSWLKVITKGGTEGWMNASVLDVGEDVLVLVSVEE